MFEKYSEYKDSEVNWLGYVPKNWELTRLGTRFEERRTKVSDKDFPPLSVTKNGILPQLDSAAKSNDGDNRKLVRLGDFVINSRSDRKGSSGVSNLDGSVSLINIVMEPKNLNSNFCHYYLKSYSFIEEFYRMGHGIVADLWTTRYDEMKAIIVAIPPVVEQTVIANFLDRKTAQIDKAISIKEKQIELLKERRQILIHNAVTRGLDPDVKMKDSGVEWIGEIPEHWVLTKAKFYSNVFVPERAKPELNIDGNGWPWITTEHLRSSELLATHATYSVSDVDKRKTGSRVLKANSVIATCVGNFGIASKLNFDCIINQQLQGFTDLRINPDYLTSIIEISEDYFKNNATLTTIMYVSKDTFGCLPIVLPSDEEQAEIVNFLKKTKAKIAAAISLKQKEIEKLKEYKSTLINSAVTGKIKVS